MTDYLALIERIIEEHRKIREHVRLAGEAVNDIEAMFTLQRATSGWAQSSLEGLRARQGQLLQAVSFLEEGLKNHFGFEEEYLPPLFGEQLMNALIFEHRGVRRQIAKARDMLASARLEKLNQRELLAKKAEIQQTISDISQTVEEHARHEEIILDMMKKALTAGDETTHQNG